MIAVFFLSLVPVSSYPDRPVYFTRLLRIFQLVRKGFIFLKQALHACIFNVYIKYAAGNADSTCFKTLRRQKKAHFIYLNIKSLLFITYSGSLKNALNFWYIDLILIRYTTESSLIHHRTPILKKLRYVNKHRNTTIDTSRITVV